MKIGDVVEVLISDEWENAIIIDINWTKNIHQNRYLCLTKQGNFWTLEERIRYPFLHEMAKAYARTETKI